MTVPTTAKPEASDWTDGAILAMANSPMMTVTAVVVTSATVISPWAMYLEPDQNASA